MDADTIFAASVLCRGIVGAVFLRSAWGKLADRAGFADGLVSAAAPSAATAAACLGQSQRH